MNRRFQGVALCFLGFLAYSLEAGGLEFEEDVKPILKTHCLACHGDEKKKGGLSFAHWIDYQEALSRDVPLLVAGNPAESLLIERILHSDPQERMPKGRDPLSAAEISTIEAWIEAGAKWDDDGWRPSPHWAFVDPIRARLPEVEGAEWCRTEIDSFVLRRLQDLGLAPSPEAGRAQLVRRLYFDLIGLPPSVDEVDAVVNDLRGDAYERLVDRLLASPAFGEKWARHWLDLARYADSEGYQRDELRNVWPYRDWVIGALNRDLPFDQFTIEQLAGDLLPEARPDQIVATGFHRNTPVNLEAGTNPDDDYHKQIVDRVNTTGTVWLGLTVGCAQCHDHKYDPLSSEEYYQLFAFFNRAPLETKQKGDGMGSAGMVYIGPNLTVPMDTRIDRRRLTWVREQKEAAERLEAYVEPFWSKAESENRKDQDKQLRKRLIISLKKRTIEDYRFVGNALLENDDTYQRWRARLAHAELMLARYPVAETRVMSDRVDRESFVLRRGNRESRGKRVSPATPRFLHGFPEQYPKNRVGLAKWLVARENPLVARVAVNRLWAELFGRGLVRTIDDFGKTGEKPSHPELLDWLAVTFVVDDEWSLKRTIRRMVLSATYRQQTAERSLGLKVDADNRFLWRHSGHRFDAELIRDQLLSLGGLLSDRMGGVPAYPWQPEGVWRSSAGAGPMSYPVAEGEDGYRRGIYTVWRRSAHYPSFSNFDAPDRSLCVVERNRSNTPLQALTLMNDAVYVEAAKAFARRIEQHASDGLRGKLGWAFRTALAREPNREELQVLEEAYLLESRESKSFEEGFFNVATILLNLHETICRN